MPASFLKRHADFFVYCVFGAMATAVNMGSYEILYRIMGLANVPSVALSWALAVTFAFFTNKYIVFRKKDGKGQDKGLPPSSPGSISAGWQAEDLMLLSCSSQWI